MLGGTLRPPQVCAQDDVPSFDDEVAFAIMEEELGRSLGEVFSSISEHPIAAASLGQVCRGWVLQVGVGCSDRSTTTPGVFRR